MAVTIKRVRQAIPGTNSAVNFDVSGFGTPQAAIIVAVETSADDTDNDEYHFSLGMWDGTNSRCHNYWAEHNVAIAAGRSRRGISNANVMQFTDSITGNLRNATVTSTRANGIELTFAGSTSQLGYVEVWLINGLNNAAVGHSTNSNTIGSPGVSVSGLGFQPKSLICSQTNLNVGDADGGRAEQSIGFAVDDDAGGVKQFGYVNVWHLANSGTCMIRNDCVTFQAANGTVYTRQEIKSFDSGGFTRYTENVDSGGTPNEDDLLYLALDFDGQVDLFTSTVPTTAVDWVPWSSGSFMPTATIMLPTQMTALDTERTNSETGMIGLYVYDGDTEGQMSGVMEDSPSTNTNTSNRMSTSEIFIQDETGGTPNFSAGADANTFTYGTITYDKDDTNFSAGSSAFYVAGLVFGGIGTVWVNDAATWDAGAVEQTYPGNANWADGQIDMQNALDTTGLTPPLYLGVENADGAIAWRAFSLSGGLDQTIIVPRGPLR